MAGEWHSSFDKDRASPVERNECRSALFNSELPAAPIAAAGTDLRKSDVCADKKVQGEGKEGRVCIAYCARDTRVDREA